MQNQLLLLLMIQLPVVDAEVDDEVGVPKGMDMRVVRVAVAAKVKQAQTAAKNHALVMAEFLRIPFSTVMQP
jgi:hypothetical protein